MPGRAAMRLAATPAVAIAVAVLIGVILTYGATSDLPAFLLAAERVAQGESPYAPAYPIHNYLYSPWLAYLLVPATWIPWDIFSVAWHAALATALGAALLPLLRARTLEATLAAGLIGAFGFHAVWAGHFQPLMICLLVYALPTRWGPAAIGVAASLKVTPLLLVIPYLARHEWRSASMAVGVAALLWAPALALGVDQYAISPGHTLSLFGYAPVAWAVVAALALLVAWRLGRTRYAWLAAATAWLAVMPRVLAYDVTVLLVAGVRTTTAKPSSAAIAIGEREHGYVVPMNLAPAGVLGSAGDEGGLGRQDDRIGAVRVQD